MNLIREECEKALKEIENATTEIDDFNSIPEITYNEFKNQLNVLNQLINEHFDNSPLKFEELEAGKWYWYEPLKEWKKIYRINPFREYFQWIEFNDGYLVQFKENVFYRKEVQE